MVSKMCISLGLCSALCKMTQEETACFLRDGLKALGAYSPAFEPLISATAQMAGVCRESYAVLMSDGIVVEEFSREGDSRKRANPAWSIFIEASKELRAQLSELQMTVRTAKFTSGDEVDKLNHILQQIYDETTKSKRSDSTEKRGRRAAAKR